jgi:hypothetical protein
MARLTETQLATIALKLKALLSDNNIQEWITGNMIIL